jgi:hypothetical protein
MPNPAHHARACVIASAAQTFNLHGRNFLITAEINGGFLRDKWRDVAGWGGTLRDGVLQK